MATERQIPMAGGQALSSEVPALHLLTLAFLVRTARRCTLGIRRKGVEKAWNANSKNQQVLDDRAFLIDRLGHMQWHAALLMEKLRSGADLTSEDDAGALGWGAMFACSAVDRLITLELAQPDKALAWLQQAVQRITAEGLAEGTVYAAPGYDTAAYVRFVEEHGTEEDREYAAKCTASLRQPVSLENPDAAAVAA